MGKIMSLMTRPAKTFNVANRAFKIISKDKPTAAPKYKASEEQLKLAQKLNPDFMKEHYTRDLKLDENLKDVYIKSTDPEGTGEAQKSKQPLPQIRTQSDEFEYGFWEPAKVPVGKVTLRNTIAFMSEYATDYKKHTVESIAEKHKLDVVDVGHVLKYFKLMKVTLIEKKKEKHPPDVDGERFIPETPIEKIADGFRKRF